MSEFLSLRPQQLIRALKKAGFSIERTKGKPYSDEKRKSSCDHPLP